VKALIRKLDPKLFPRSGFAISCIGHMVILTVGLFFAGANPFDSVPADAITVEIVSPDEVGAGSNNPGTAPAGGPEIAPSTKPAAEPAATAPQPQPTPPSTPQATPQATTPPDQHTTRQALAPTQAVPSSPPSFVPWLQPPPAPPPPQPPPPAEPPQERSPADMFGMPLAMPDGSLGGSFDAAAIDKADVSNDNIAAFHQHLKTCSKLPAGVNVADNVRAVLRIFLKPDGTLAAPPQPIRIEGVSRGGGELYQSVVAALRKCQPFKMLPPDKYDEWKVFDLSFTPQSFGGG
jgi:hypothetical protein